MDAVFDPNAVKDRIIGWIARYFSENAAPSGKAVIGISGGKDSSVAAALCAAALGRERVLGVLLPQGVQDDIEAARDICETLGISNVEMNIGEPVRSFFAELGKTGLRANSVALYNTPARLRMAALYAVSGTVGGRVVNTSNLSEDWVGYATKYGDSAGDFGPLSRLTVTEVKAVGRALGLAERFIEKPPLDGLTGKTDEENFGFTYQVLDRYIREGVCEDAAVKEKIDRLHMANLHKVRPMPVYDE